MFGHLVGLELFLAVLTGCHFVEFFLMLFLEVDVVHFSAIGAFFDVSSAVAEVGGNLGFGEGFEAVVTDFGGLLGHGYQGFWNNFFNLLLIRNVKLIT